MASNIDILKFESLGDLKIEYEDILEKNCKELAEAIASDAPSKRGHKSKYAKSWTYKMKRHKDGSAYGAVYNKSNPSLGGWLEFGHFVWNAKRIKRTKPQPHILPNYQKQKEKYIKDMERAKIK